MSIPQSSYHIIAVARQVGAPFTTLDSEQCRRLRQKVMERFASGESRWLWENLWDSASIQDPEGWQLIERFLAGDPFILFFNEYEDRIILEFPAGARLTPILWECPGFEFYVTDRNTDYLLCFNHHDFLIGAGRASRWDYSRIETEL